MSGAIAVTSPVGDRFAGEPHRRLKAGQLQFGVLRAFVDDALFERLPDDLAHALGRQPLLGSDLVIGPALAQARENAPPPQHPPMRGEPARQRLRPVVDHACLAWPPAWRPLLTERSIIAWIWKIGKQNLRIFFARAVLGRVEHLLAAARYVALNPVAMTQRFNFIALCSGAPPTGPRSPAPAGGRG